MLDKIVIPGIASPDPRLRRCIRALARPLLGRSGGSPPAPATACSGYGQFLSGTWFAFAHGANDAQKTMGVIALALLAHGSIDEFRGHPTWVKVAAGARDRARHLRRRLADHAHGRPARVQDRAGRRLRGAGLGRHRARHGDALRLSRLDDTVHHGLRDGRGLDEAVLGRPFGGVAGDIVTAWVLTVPAAALVAAALFWPIEAVF